MQLLYYLPGQRPEKLMRDNKADRTALIDAGLGHLVADMDDDDTAKSVQMCQVIQNGPDGGAGVVLCLKTVAGDLPLRFGVYLDRQTWHEPAEGDVWVGVDNAAPPTPEELERPGSLGGKYLLLLGDGQRWVVPTLRLPPDVAGGTMLPCSYRLDSNGAVEDIVERKYRDLWDDAGDVIDHFVTAVPEQLGPLDADNKKAWRLRLAIRTLGLNYRFGVLEQNVLGLVGSRNWQTILAVMVGTPLWPQSSADAEKKTDSDQQLTTGTPVELASLSAGSAA